MASEVINRSLYNGQYQLIHNPLARGRQPRYVVNGSHKPKGVTTIMGQTLAKDLIQWGVDCMKEELEKVLPGKITQQHLDDAAEEYIRRRDFGAGTGTEAHALVEYYLKGREKSGQFVPNVKNASPEAMNAYRAFVKWFEDVKPEVINVEEVIYSADFDYAGTYDGMLRIHDKVYLTDLKTTNASRKAPVGVYAENFIQLGAYASAHEEQRAYEEAHGGTKLVKVDGLAVISAKKDGRLDVVTNDDVGLGVKECGDRFKEVVNIYRFLTGVTKTLGGT